MNKKNMKVIIKVSVEIQTGLQSINEIKITDKIF